MNTLVEVLERLNAYLTVSQLAALLGKHPQTIYKWIRLGKLQPIRLEGRIVFDPVTIAKWINERTIV
jgi:excisionase family DNA binding protein